MTTIFVDFDGTITERDLLDRIAQTFGDPDVFAALDAGLDNDCLTLHDVLRREFEPVTATLDEVVEWVLAHASIRPGFTEFVRLTEERCWRLVILSSGFRELIEPVLAREALDRIELLANFVTPASTGWRAGFRDETVCTICGQPCKRATVLAEANGGLSIYVGDGISDRCGAEASDLVFARRGLAAYLAERGHPYVAFDDFFQIAERLHALP